MRKRTVAVQEAEDDTAEKKAEQHEGETDSIVQDAGKEFREAAIVHSIEDEKQTGSRRRRFQVTTWHGGYDRQDIDDLEATINSDTDHGDIRYNVNNLGWNVFYSQSGEPRELGISSSSGTVSYLFKNEHDDQVLVFKGCCSTWAGRGGFSSSDLLLTEVFPSKAATEKLVPLSTLVQLHPASDEKVTRREKALENGLGRHFQGTVDETVLKGLSDQSMLSGHPIQVLDLRTGDYLVTNGNGRLAAMRAAFDRPLGVMVDVQEVVLDDAEVAHLADVTEKNPRTNHLHKSLVALLAHRLPALVVPARAQ